MNAQTSEQLVDFDGYYCFICNRHTSSNEQGPVVIESQDYSTIIVCPRCTKKVK